MTEGKKMSARLRGVGSVFVILPGRSLRAAPWATPPSADRVAIERDRQAMARDSRVALSRLSVQSKKETA